MKLKFWERKMEVGAVKYKAIRPPGSNGYVYVLREGAGGPDDLYTCFGAWDVAMKNAMLIADALNAYAGDGS